MKRPLCWITLIVLSGSLCGLKETEAVIKAAGMIGFLLMTASLWKSRGLKKKPLLFLLCLCGLSLCLFLTGFFRSRQLSKAFSEPEAAAFYERYAPTNPAEFDYALYLKGEGIENEAARKESREGYQGDFLPLKWVAAFKTFCGDMLQSLFSKEDAGIYQALILGEKKEMDEGIRSLYQKSGISHLLAVSGLHVSLIGMGFYQMLRKCGLSLSAAGGTASVLVLLYGILTGASGSTIRAVIMLLLRFLASALGQSFDMLSAISMAALLLILENPYRLMQSGFQLSFAAVLAISLWDIFMKERKRKRISCSEGHRSQDRSCLLPLCTGVSSIISCEFFQRLKQSFAVNVMIQLVTLPIILYHYFTFPIYGIFLNLLLIPLMTYVMCAGLFALLSGFLGKLFGSLMIFCGMGLSRAEGIRDILMILPVCFGAAGHYILEFYEKACLFFQKFPMHTICPGRPEIWQILLYYGLFAALFWYFMKRQERTAEETKSAVQRKNGQEAKEEGKTTYKKTLRERLDELRQMLLHAGVLKRIFPVATAVLVMSFCMFYRLPLPKDTLSITAMDVGQGDGFLLRYGEAVILIDGGSSSDKSIGKNVLEPLLLSEGITRIDYAFLSHADVDHASGLLYLLEESEAIQIEQLVLPKAASGHEAYQEIISAAGKLPGAEETNGRAERKAEQKTGIKDRLEQQSIAQNTKNGNNTQNETSEIRYIREGEAFIFDGGKDCKTENKKALSKAETGTQTKTECRDTEILAAANASVPVMTCLYAGENKDDINGHSPIMLLRYGDFSMLFTGDTGVEDEKELFRKYGNRGKEGSASSRQLQETFRKQKTEATWESGAMESGGAVVINGILPIPLTILKSPHHGSKSSNSDYLLKLFQPRFTLLSYGKKNRYGHPSKEVLERFLRYETELLETAKSGAITIRTDGVRMEIEGFIMKS